MNRTAQLGIVVGAVLVAALRWLLCVHAPGQLHPVDPAELELLWLAEQVHGAGLSGGALSWEALSWEELLRQLGRASNVHHGGYLPVSLTVLLASVVVGPTYAAIKLSAVAWSTGIWCVWTLLALRLGGGRAAIVAGVALALPVPWATQWWLTGWGSHSEVGLLVGLALLTWGRPLAVGGLAGLAAAFAPVVLPTMALLVVLRRNLQAVVAAVLGFGLLQLGRPWWRGASVTEDPGQTVGGLAGGALEPGRWLDALGTHLPPPLVASEVAPAWLSWPLMAGLAVAAVLVWRRGGLQRWVVALPVVHLLAVVVLSPFSPALHHRYLLPWLPAVLLWPAVAASGRVWVPWAVLGLLPSLLAAPVMMQMLRQPVTDYRPRAYLALGLDRVPAEWVDDVNCFLDHRGQAATPGFSAGWTRRWGYPILGEPFPAIRTRAGLQGRLLAMEAEGYDLDALARDAGWGVAVINAWDEAATGRVLAPLTQSREDALSGVTEGEVVCGLAGLGRK